MDSLRRPDLRIGFLPTPDFTMLAMAGFIDSLRLAADEGDRSRPIRCAWWVMSADRQPIAASNGVAVTPTAPLLDPASLDYVAVVGGTLHRGPRESPEMVAYLRRAAAAGTPLIGVCTGSFVLARAGLMQGRRTCVSWFHYDDFAAEFPDLDAQADRLFIEDGPRITCAGGVSVLHLASHLIERHCERGHSEKGLRVMIEEGRRLPDAPQPQPRMADLPAAADARVRRAMLLMERDLQNSASIADVAEAVGASPRQLTRLFRAAAGLSPGAYQLELRLARAHRLLEGSSRSVAEIAFECGFADASHLARSYRRTFGCSPREQRGRAASQGSRAATASISTSHSGRKSWGT